MPTLGAALLRGIVLKIQRAQAAMMVVQNGLRSALGHIEADISAASKALVDLAGLKSLPSKGGE